jgi:hypothetical protein
MTKEFLLKTIHENLAGEMLRSNKIDEKSGEFKKEAVIKIHAAGQVVEFPDEFAADLRRAGHTRAPTPLELMLFERANGGKTL